MDRLSRLIPFVVALLVFAAGTLPRVAFASWTGMSNTQSEAAAACNADGKSLVDQNKADFPSQVSKANPHYTCVSRTGSCDNYGWIGCYTLSFYVYDEIRGGGVYGWGVQGAPPKNPCDGLKAKTYQQAGKVLDGVNACMPSPQPDGSSVQCGFVFKPSGTPMQNQWGSWNTYGTLTPTGDVCGAGQGPSSGSGWQQDGNAPTQPPAPPPQDGADTVPPPKLCGNVSCYKPDTGEYCTQGSEGEICTKGAPPGSSSGGSCATKGDTTLCAGSPQAPKPPENKVPDPPTQTRGTDAYQSADPETGDVHQNTASAYTTGPGVVSNGSTSSGDVKPPASSSSSGGTPSDDKKGDGTEASGGGDCSNPPAVSGSPALAMVATQAWQTRCATNQVHKDLAGDGSASPGDPTAPSGQSAWVDTPTSGDATADAANKGVYDMGGMGFASACPMKDLEVPIWWSQTVAIHFSQVCPVGGWIKAIVIGFALFGAVTITAGGKR